MSSFLAKLVMDGEKYTVLKCSYKFKKPVDAMTKPSGEVKGGKIHMTVETRGNMELLEWIIAPEKEKNGMITFFRRDALSRLFGIEFKKAQCIKFKEEFNSTNGMPMNINFTIVARSIKFNHLEFNNDWTI